MPAFAMTTVFQLAPHVNFCRADDRIVFLHLERGRYFQLTEKQAEWFRTLQAASNPGALVPEVARFGAQLVSMGLLSLGPDASRPIREHLSPAASSSAMDYPLKARPRHDLTLLPGLAASVLMAGLALKRTGLCKTFRALRRQKQIAAHSGVRSGPALPLATEFRGWSPFFFSQHDACLFRSLALAHFLYSRGVPASLVIAVRCQPFRAHAWVQHDATILNDHLDSARDYSPIFSV